MLPAETFNAIKTLAQTAQTSIRTKANGHTFIDNIPGKEPQYALAVPSAVVRKINRLEDFVNLLTARKDGGFTSDGFSIPFSEDFPDNPMEVSNEGSVVYFDAGHVVYQESPGDLRGLTAHMAMVMTPEFKWLAGDSVKSYDHKEFVRVLRIVLRNCLPASNLLSIVREAKFNTNAVANSVQQVSRQSFGRDVQAEVIGLQAIPEEVVLMVQPFENLKNKFKVECAIEIDASTSSFKLTPFPGQLVDAVDAAMNVIYNRVVEIVPAYYGRPE